MLANRSISVTHRPQFSLCHRYRATFGIFPAMIPLIEILPWLLGLIGGVAGVSEYLRETFLNRPRLKWLMIVAVLCVLAAPLIYIGHQMTLPDKGIGSEVVLKENLPKIETFTPTQPTGVNLAGRPFGVVWEQRPTDQILGTPFISNELLLIGLGTKKLEARSIYNGEKVWTMTKDEPIFTTAAVSQNIGIIGEGLHTAPAASLTAFYPMTGVPIWGRRFRSHIESAPAISDNGMVFQSVGADGIWALDLHSGDVEWKSLIGHIDVTPALTPTGLYVPAKLTEEADGSALFKLDSESGDVVWQKPVPGNPMGDTLTTQVGEIVFTTAIGQVGLNKDTDAGWLSVYSPINDQLKTYALPAAPLPEGSLYQDKNMIILTLKDGTLYALNYQTGEKVWSLKLGQEFRSDAAFLIHSGMPLIAAVTADGFGVIRNAADGTPVTSFKINSGGYAAPIFYSDKLYVFETNAIVAYGPVSALLKK